MSSHTHISGWWLWCCEWMLLSPKRRLHTGRKEKRFIWQPESAFKCKKQLLLNSVIISRNLSVFINHMWHVRYTLVHADAVFYLINKLQTLIKKFLVRLQFYFWNHTTKLFKMLQKRKLQACESEGHSKEILHNYCQKHCTASYGCLFKKSEMKFDVFSLS